MVEQVGTTVFAERALRPFGRMIAGDVRFTVDFRRLGGNQRKRRTAAPSAAHAAMAGVDVFVVFHF